MPALTIPNFGGGVILAGSADAQSTNELQQCDGFQIGPRGQLESDHVYSAYGVRLNDTQVTPQPVAHVYGMAGATFATDTQCLAISGGLDTTTPKYFTHIFAPNFTVGAVQNSHGIIGTTRTANGALCTFAAFPYVDASGVQQKPLFFNTGARSVDVPRSAPGLYVARVAGTLGYPISPISNFDALGTGPFGQFPGGSKSVQFYFRGIVGYNNHLFGWGFDNNDATNGDGPSRVMFSNVGNPFMFGNDNLAAVGTDRSFSDTDAITIGAAGEIITAGVASRGRLYFGTNRGLHYLSGYGRDSFQTDGTTGVTDSLDVLGPGALIEGPDGLLYGVSTQGFWCLNAGGGTIPLFRSLVDFRGKSPGYFDLIWSDPTASPGYPGTTNADLVWLLSDRATMSVWIVIPFTDFQGGAGSGTAILKYHTETGGFTRHFGPLTTTAFTCGTSFRRNANTQAVTVLGDSGSANTLTVRQYPSLSPDNTPRSGTVTFGEYAPYGTQGTGTNRVAYLTLSWSAGALPITGILTPSVDQRTIDSVALAIGPTAPVSPANGDVWVDTSETDTNLGNGTSSSMIAAANVYLVKMWVASWSAWRIISRSAGAQGTRITVPVAYDATRGTRVKFTWVLSSGGDLQIEGIGMAPSTVRSAA